MPELPITVDEDQKQVTGERDKEFVQSHRGKKRDQLTQPPQPAQGHMRYPEDS